MEVHAYASRVLRSGGYSHVGMSLLQSSLTDSRRPQYENRPACQLGGAGVELRLSWGDAQERATSRLTAADICPSQPQVRSKA